MAAPTWDQYMAPSLQVLNDGEIRRNRSIVEGAAELLELTDEQRQIVIPSGQDQWVNRGNWALSYLHRVGAIERTSRAHYRITDVGRRLLADHPGGITERDLRALSGDPNAPHTWKAFPTPTSPLSYETVEADTVLDPREQIEAGVARIHEEIAADLLSRLCLKEPAFFEHAVVRLLVLMGYGGTDAQVTVTQRSNDGGIDGIIDQDALGLDRVYVQAKRYTANPVQRPELQAFVGALSGLADGGVFITTSTFSKGARAYAASIPTRIILIDGERLTRLMIKYGVGVQVESTYKVVKVDEDFFE